MIKLAWFQVRALPIDSGHNILSVLAATDAAFTAAHLHHLKHLAADAIAGLPGPYIQPPHSNLSTSLFSDPLQTAYAHFVTH
jgi:hypothetical protein